ncbi:MAG: AmmeMemoRadiSam system protein B [Rhodospirillales bacterium]
MNQIRKAAVAGQFYPGTATELDTAVRGFLNAAETSSDPVPKAIIAPHAGYAYSGAVAASAYARLAPAHAIIKRVVLLGPCHRVAVQGLALSGADAFETPLGQIPVDTDAAAEILKMAQVQVFDATHAEEHSLEVHLPFLQVILDDFSVVPLVVGDASPEDVADVIEALWGGEETLIVVSSDLSHYLDYDAAQRIDTETCRAIENLDGAAISPDGACGRFPVGGLLEVAKRRGLSATTLDLRNSGDTAGSKDKVVGYGSWAFQKAPNSDKESTGALLAEHGASIVRLAAATILHGLNHGKPLDVKADDFPAALLETGACFVTLKRAGILRGCIGSAEARRPLFEDIAENGYRTAFKDPRFPALKMDELEGLDMSVSVLSPQTEMNFSDEGDFLSQLRPGIDGLVIEDNNRRALFLPSVWRQLPDRATFTQHLKAKAGLSKDHWSDTFRAWRFEAGEVSAAELDDPASLWRN